MFSCWRSRPSPRDSSRLDRKIDTNPKPFGSPDYGKEELVAEMSAAFLCSYAGIQPTVIEKQAAYLARPVIAALSRDFVGSLSIQRKPEFSLGPSSCPGFQVGAILLGVFMKSGTHALPSAREPTEAWTVRVTHNCSFISAHYVRMAFSIISIGAYRFASYSCRSPNQTSLLGGPVFVRRSQAIATGRQGS